MNSACIFYRIFFNLARGKFNFPQKIFVSSSQQAAGNLPRRLSCTVSVYVGDLRESAAAVVAAAAAAVHFTAVPLIAAADPDQDDNNNDPPPVVFAEERVRRTHTFFPPIKDFTSYYGGITRLVTLSINLFLPARRHDTPPAHTHLQAGFSQRRFPLYI